MKTVFNSALLIAGAIILASDIGYAYLYRHSVYGGGNYSSALPLYKKAFK